MLIDDAEVRNLGWSEERKSSWRIERLLEEEIKLLRQIISRLPPPPTYEPTNGIVVIPQ
jgi:hypothetical protein